MALQTYHDLTISDLLNGDLQLATLPSIYLELVKVIDDPRKSALDAARVIDKDPSLTLKLLKLVNSAFYGFPARIASIDRAITLVGNRDLLNLTLSTVLIDKFSSLPGSLICMHDYWSRSLRCALLSKEISMLIDTPKKLDTDSVFICGLLHDIGQLVFFRRIPELAREINMIIDDNCSNEVEVELSILGFDHFETGAGLARLWNLPAVIQQSILQHTNPSYDGEFKSVATITRAANHICKMHPDHSFHSLAGLGLSEDKVDRALNKMLDEFEAIFQVFFPSSAAA